MRPSFFCFLLALKGGYGRWGGRDRYGPPVRTDYRLIVENLSSRCSWQDLKDYMRQAGEVTYADTHKGRRNEGVIEFRQYSDMKRALEKLDGTEVNGRKIRLIEDRPGAKRRRSYSRSHSRSRSVVSLGLCSVNRSPKSKKGKKDGKKSKKGSRSRSRSASRSRSRSRSGLKDSSRKSVSKGPDPPKSDDEAGEPERGSRSRSRSRSPDEPRARSKSKSKSQSPAGARSRSASRSESRSKSRSQSRSRSRSRS
uniref:RRM domain-containing protein n=1 Tax=Oryzias latipes TaxID=8090 RepID=H2M099_ORYLA